MNPLEVNPLFIIGASAVLYAIIVFLRQQAFYLLLLFLAIVNFGFIFLDSGKDTVQVLQKQPQTIERVECLVQSLSKGAPLVADASAGLSSCHFNGTGIGATNNSKIENLITSEPGS